MFKNISEYLKQALATVMTWFGTVTDPNILKINFSELIRAIIAGVGTTAITAALQMLAAYLGAVFPMYAAPIVGIITIIIDVIRRQKFNDNQLVMMEKK